MKERHNLGKLNRLKRLEKINPKKGETVKRMLEVVTERKKLQKMTVVELVAFADEHGYTIDPEGKKAEIIREILAQMFPPPDEEPTEPADYPEGAPSMTWTKAQLMAYADANGIEYSTSWTKAELLETIEAAA